VLHHVPAVGSDNAGAFLSPVLKRVKAEVGELAASSWHRPRRYRTLHEDDHFDLRFAIWRLRFRISDFFHGILQGFYIQFPSIMHLMAKAVALAPATVVV